MAAAALAHCMAHIQRQLGKAAPNTWPAPAVQARVQARVQQLLQAFVAEHAALFDFDSFPLPTEAGQAMASYTLHSDDDHPAEGLCLRVNSIAAGVHSAVHDHGCWALILGLQGEEINHVYRRATAAATTPASHAPVALPALAGLWPQAEVRVRPGQALWLSPHHFHSIHTPDHAPALQLHLYGGDPDHCPGRYAVEPASGRWVALPPLSANAD